MRNTMKVKDTDLKIKGTFEIFDPKTGKVIKRELNTSYYPGEHQKDEQTIVKKCLKKALADISLLKPIKEVNQE